MQINWRNSLKNSKEYQHDMTNFEATVKHARQQWKAGNAMVIITFNEYLELMKAAHGTQTPQATANPVSI